MGKMNVRQVPGLGDRGLLASTKSGATAFGGYRGRTERLLRCTQFVVFPAAPFIEAICVRALRAILGGLRFSL